MLAVRQGNRFRRDAALNALSCHVTSSFPGDSSFMGKQGHSRVGIIFYLVSDKDSIKTEPELGSGRRRINAYRTILTLGLTKSPQDDTLGLLSMDEA